MERPKMPKNSLIEGACDGKIQEVLAKQLGTCGRTVFVAMLRQDGRARGPSERQSVVKARGCSKSLVACAATRAAEERWAEDANRAMMLETKRTCVQERDGRSGG